MDATLTRALKAAGLAADTVEFADGTQLLLLPRGGRVLGWFAPGDRSNFLWVNPILGRAAAARAWLASGQWQNFGGERTWIGPEYAFFFPKYPDLAGYRPPAVLDASTYMVTRPAGAYELAAVYSLDCAAPRALVRVRVTRRIGAAPDPLRPPGGPRFGAAVQFAGYSARTTLTVLSSSGPLPPGALGLWSIAQLPHGGEMIVPVYGRARPTVFFGRIPRGDLRVRRSLVHYRMNSDGEHKIGVRPYATTGRFGYIRSVGPNRRELVIRNIFANPSADHPDAPVASLGNGGYAFQACSVNHPQLGRFSELEHHAPALGGDQMQGEDVAQMWAYRGPARQIADIAEALLGGSGYFI